MNYQIIHSFNDVKLKNNYLLVFDMDETILYYEGICEKWWTNKRKDNYELCFDHIKAETKTITEWENHIKDAIPNHTDADGFFNLLKQAKIFQNEVIIVTARNLEIKDVTIQHLNYLNIFNIDVHFVAGGNKGSKINDVMNKKINEYDQIVFIDDMDHNLKNVKEYFGDKVICYKFIKIEK